MRVVSSLEISSIVAPSWVSSSPAGRPRVSPAARPASSVSAREMRSAAKMAPAIRISPSSRIGTRIRSRCESIAFESVDDG